LQLAKQSRRDSEVKTQLLLKYKYGKRWFTRYYNTLEEAASGGSQAMLRLLLKSSVKVNRLGGKYDMLLRLAKEASTDSEAKVELLLKYKYGKRWVVRYNSAPEEARREGSDYA
jgi:phosphoglucomutase